VSAQRRSRPFVTGSGRPRAPGYLPGSSRRPARSPEGSLSPDPRDVQAASTANDAAPTGHPRPPVSLPQPDLRPVASTTPARPPPTARNWSCGTATAPPTSSGPSCRSPEPGRTTPRRRLLIGASPPHKEIGPSCPGPESPVAASLRPRPPVCRPAPHPALAGASAPSARGFRHAGHGRYFGTAADSGRPGHGTRTEIRDAGGGAHQRRRASRNGDGPCTLTNVASGRALEVPAGQSAHGAPVRIRDSTHGADRHPNLR
jgi:hypothetical protein